MRSKSPEAAAAERESEGKDKERRGAELVGNGWTDGDRGEIRQVSALARPLARAAVRLESVTKRDPIGRKEV